MTEAKQKKIEWHSRRGMLELDLLLVPFANSCFAKLSDQQQCDYEELLNCEDQDLFIWLMQREMAPQENFRRLVRLILANAGVEV
jgi:antitoxin CptB